MSVFQKIEFQKIAVGLLGMSHPEIYRSRIASTEPARQTGGSPALKPTRGSKPRGATTALRDLKFALAALLAGARSIPLGDNGRITRELGEYGVHLRGC
jgi:hypothetical protein